MAVSEGQSLCRSTILRYIRRKKYDTTIIRYDTIILNQNPQISFQDLLTRPDRNFKNQDRSHKINLLVYFEEIRCSIRDVRRGIPGNIQFERYTRKIFLSFAETNQTRRQGKPQPSRNIPRLPSQTISRIDHPVSKYFLLLSSKMSFLPRKSTSKTSIKWFYVFLLVVNVPGKNNKTSQEHICVYTWEF